MFDLRRELKVISGLCEVELLFQWLWSMLWKCGWIAAGAFPGEFLMYQPKGGSLPSSPGGFWLHPLPLQTPLLHCSLLRALGSCVCRCCCLGFWRPARTRFLPQAAPASRSCLCLPFMGLSTLLPFVPAGVMVELGCRRDAGEGASGEPTEVQLP